MIVSGCPKVVVATGSDYCGPQRLFSGDGLERFSLVGYLCIVCQEGSMSISGEADLMNGLLRAGTRKVILATNIAETSVTFSDVVYVVDGGRANVATFDSVNNTPQLGPQVGQVPASHLDSMVHHAVNVMRPPNCTL